MTDRVCFTLQVKPDRLDEYRERHRAVWPAMLAALDRTGWRNYSLFLRDDGLLVGYFEADDAAASQARMAETEANAEWQAFMSDLFVDEATPADRAPNLPQVFNLAEQLARSASAGDPATTRHDTESKDNA